MLIASYQLIDIWPVFEGNAIVNLLLDIEIGKGMFWLPNWSRGTNTCTVDTRPALEGDVIVRLFFRHGKPCFLSIPTIILF